ncbi:MAG: hypothetical protein ACYC2K_10060 [Gemmatimonadales bacterium]
MTAEERQRIVLDEMLDPNTGQSLGKWYAFYFKEGDRYMAITAKRKIEVEPRVDYYRAHRG